jgi:TolA-binding protein
MTDKLNEIFETIKGWTVEEIQSILYHREWTQRKTIPFEKSGKSKIDPKKPPESFDERLASFAKLLKQKSHDADAEQSAKIIICSTFLLVNDQEIDGHDRFSQIRSRDGVDSKLLELLDEMDSTTHRESIQKRQLFYALFKQREDESFTIKKVTWKNVTSDWGPKIVMSDGKHYYYIFSNNGKEPFETLRKRYNIAAKLGRAEQYESDYEIYENEFNLKIIKVLATKDCLTLAEYFKRQKIGLKGNSSGKRLFEKLGEEFFRNKLKTGKGRTSDELKKILPRLIQNEKGNACLDAILGRDKWIIPRTQIRVDKQTYFAVHGDEWGGNFLVAEAARQVFVIDFEDVIYANANDEENIVGVGGDLSTRIFNATKDGPQTFLPIGLSTFASIGRLLAAVVQYHSRYNELQNNNIREIIHNYLESFAKALDESSDGNHVVKSNHWDTDLEQLILLHAWDWALYWEKKDVFPPESFEVFVKEIKNLLCKGHDDKADSTHKSAPPNATKIEKMPSENIEARDKKTIDDRNIERADDAAWDWYLKGDYKAAEEGWKDALQMLNDSQYTEDRGYFEYWMTRASYLNDKDVPRAVKSMLQCIETCKAEEDDEWLMDSLLFTAYLLTEGDIGQARHILDQIVSLYNDGEFEEKPEPFVYEQLLEWPEKRSPYYGNAVLCRIKSQAANFFLGTGDLANSANLYENLMHYYVGVQKHDDADNARVNLGILKSYLGEYEKSDALQNQCLTYRRERYAKLNDGDTRKITKALRNLGQNAMEWKKYDKAKQYFADCIFELQKVPNEIIIQHKLEGFIIFNQNLIEKCVSLKEIRRIQIHERNENRVRLLIEAMECSDSHKNLYVVSILSNMTDPKEALGFSKSIKEKNLPPKLALNLARLLYNKFLQADEAKRFLNSIEIEDLDQKMKIEVLLMYETVHFMESQNKDELIAYHSSLQQEYSIEYPNILVEIHYEWGDKLEMQNLMSLFTDLVELNKEQQRFAIVEFFESEPSRIARHFFVRIIVDCMKGGGEYRDKLFAGSFILSSNAITKLCLNNLTYISRYYTDSYNDVHDFLTLAGFSGISYANENRTDKHKLEHLEYKLSKLGELYQTRWLGAAEREICNDIFSFITKGLLGNIQKKFDAWDSILQQIINLNNINSKKYLFALLHSVMIWDTRMYQRGFLLKSKTRMKELANVLVKWIHSEPNVFSLSTIDPRKKSARKLFKMADVPEYEWDIAIRTDFVDELD